MPGGQGGHGLLASETGSRQQSRLRVYLPAIITTADGTRHVFLQDLSLRGARLLASEGLYSGQQVLLQWHGFQALGVVRWIDGHTCGLGFYRSLPIRHLLDTRDLIEAPDPIEQVNPGPGREVVRRNADAFVNGRVRL